MSEKPGNPMHELLRQQLGIDAFALDGDARDQPEAWSDRTNTAHSATQPVRPVALKPLERRWPSLDPPRRN
jgi:hypothetical protein